MTRIGAENIRVTWELVTQIDDVPGPYVCCDRWLKFVYVLSRNQEETINLL
jgi:hypothetical protein